MAHARSATAAVLYLSYDGMLEPLGASQVLRYVEKMASQHRFVLVSFEKKEDWANFERREALKAHLASSGIRWFPLRYHKRPSAIATAFDVLQGIVVGAWCALVHRVDIVHARSYVASLMAVVLKRLLGLKYVFDMRGFWADERVDGGLWAPGSRMYRLVKRLERTFLLQADCVVSLTQAAVDEMRSFPYLRSRAPRFEVITTCADLDTFRPALDAPKDQRPFTLGYVGSVGVWYLFDEVLTCFRILRERIPGARLHIVNKGGHEYIRQRLQAAGMDMAAVTVEALEPAGVARAMQHMDAAAFFIKPAYSKIASAPTRLGEFLGCGVPCLSNRGVGDMADVLESEQVGIAVNDFGEDTLARALEDLVRLAAAPAVRMRCREAALRRFSLDEGVRRYLCIYDEIDGTGLASSGLAQ